MLTPRGGKRDPVLVGEVDELFEFDGSTVEPVEIPSHDGADLAGADVGEHALVRGPRLPGAGTGVVVRVLDWCPAPSGAHRQAVLALAGDREAIVVGVERLS